MIELEIEVVSVTGLDDAIIGTAMRNSREVLAYDFAKTVQIVLNRGLSMEEAEDYVSDLAERDFEGAPVFIYVDNEPRIYGSEHGPGTTVH